MSDIPKLSSEVDTLCGHKK